MANSRQAGLTVIFSGESPEFHSTCRGAGLSVVILPAAGPARDAIEQAVMQRLQQYMQQGGAPLNIVLNKPIPSTTDEQEAKSDHDDTKAGASPTSGLV
jgi:hypothetical protein